MANEFIARKGLIVLANGATITGSLAVQLAVTASEFSGSGASLNNIPFAKLTGVPIGLVSGSTQVVSLIAGQQISPTGITSSLVGNASTATTASYALTASVALNVPVTSSYAVTASAAQSITFTIATASYALTAGATGGGLTGNGVAQKNAVWSGTSTLITGSLTDLGAGIGVSSASPITASAFSGNGAAITGVVSASYATNAGSANNATSSSFATNALTANTATTASYALTSIFTGLTNVPVGLVTSSAQISYTALQNIPIGIMSSSAQTIANIANQAIAPLSVNGINVLSLASTGSQTYTGVQTFQNIVVLGSSSITNISSSQLLIGENKIILNTAGPVRYGGFSVYDSGSVNSRSGSLYWDSFRDTFVVEQVGGAGGVASSSLVILGPRATTGIGNETGLTTNKIPKASPDDSGQHITDSQIIDDGTNVVIPGSLGVTGSLNVNGTIYTNGTAAVNIGTFVIATLSSTLYDGAVFTYVVKNATSVRTGQVYAAWSASVVEYTDTSTNDIGITSDVVFVVDILGGTTARLKATAASNSWTVKSIVQGL